MDYKVRILNGNTGTGAITRVLIDWHDGSERRWSTFGAGTNILDATWLALADGLRVRAGPHGPRKEGSFSMNAKIVLLPGDGIGPEVVNEARLVLDAVAKLFGHTFEYSTHLLGGCAIDATGTAMPEATLQPARLRTPCCWAPSAGPKWDDPQAKVRPEQGLLAIRKGLGLYANLRPVKAIPSLAKLSPLKPEARGWRRLHRHSRTDWRSVFRPAEGPQRDARGRRAGSRHAHLYRRRDPPHRAAGL